MSYRGKKMALADDIFRKDIASEADFFGGGSRGG